MAKLQEPLQTVQCREEDIKVVEAAMPKAQSKYKSTYGKEAPELTLDRKHFLAKGATSAEQEDDPDHPSWCARGRSRTFQSCAACSRCSPVFTA
jgi:ATP synthase (E/31 kDa) subunit